MKQLRLLPVATLLALVLVYLLAIPFGLIGPDKRLQTPEIILAGVVLLSVALLSQTGISLSDLTVGPSGISARFERLAERQSALESEVAALQMAISGLVTKFELVHLDKLAAGGPAWVRYGNIMLNELTHLDAMGFIQPIDPRGLNALGVDHGGGLDDFDLLRYVEITQEGKEYLLMRAQLRSRAAAGAAGRN